MAIHIYLINGHLYIYIYIYIYTYSEFARFRCAGTRSWVPVIKGDISIHVYICIDYLEYNVYIYIYIHINY